MRDLARQIQAQGRGEDSVLMHMTPKEVGGLQALAMAHGGTLTINPTTGLPEAGFLSSILPIVLGVAGSFVGIPPMLTAALVGGGTGLATGSLEKGLMAGLGAFGGTSLGTSLGAGSAGGLGGLFGGGAGAGAPAASIVSSGGAGVVAPGATALGGVAPGATALGGVAPTVVQPVSEEAIKASIGNFQADKLLPNIGQRFIGAANNITNPADMAKLGFGDIGWRGGAAGLGLAMPFLQPEPGKELEEEDKYDPMSEYRPLPPRQVSYPGADYGSREYSYFDPSTYPFAEGGETTLSRDRGMGRGLEQLYNFNRASPAASIDTPAAGGVRGVRGGKGGQSGQSGPGGQSDQNPVRGGKGGKGGKSGAIPTRAEMESLKATGRYSAPLQPYLQGRAQQAEAPNTKLNKGGQVHLKDGSFILDARTVSELGNGSSGAGQERLARIGGQPIKGPGDGVSDSIRANIGGTQDARIARDEVRFGPEAVRRIGGGDRNRGAEQLYRLMDKAQQQRQQVKRGQPNKGLGALLARK